MGRRDSSDWKAKNEEILRGLEEGDPELVASLLRRLAAYFRQHWTLVAHDAEDLAKDTLLKAYEILDDFAGAAPFEQWLLGIAWNTGSHAVRSFKRRKGLETEPLEEIEDWEELVAEEDFADRLVASMYLETFLQKLEPEQQTIVCRRIYEERSWSEIAQELGFTVTAAETRFQRILKKLGQWIEEEEPGLKIRRRS